MSINDFKLHSGLNPNYLKDYISKSYQNPVILEESRSFTSPVDIFSKLMNNRIIFLGNPIDSEVSNIVTAQLLYLNEKNPNEDITFYINSPGGSIIAGLAIYDTMQLIKPNIRTVCVGQASSMASVLLVSGTKGQRVILPNGRVLIHQPSSATYGTLADMAIDVEQLNKDKKILYNILAEHTGQPYEKIEADSQRDFWMNAEEALAYGCVDEIIKKLD